MMRRKDIYKSIIALVFIAVLCTPTVPYPTFSMHKNMNRQTKVENGSQNIIIDQTFITRDTIDFYDVVIDNIAIAGSINFVGHGYVLITDSSFVDYSKITIRGDVSVFIQNVNFSSDEFSFEIYDKGHLIMSNARSTGYTNVSFYMEQNGRAELENTEFRIQEVLLFDDSEMTLNNHSQTFPTNVTFNVNGNSKLSVNEFQGMSNSYFTVYLNDTAEANITNSILTESGVVTIHAYKDNKLRIENVDFGTRDNGRTIYLHKTSSAYIKNASFIDLLQTQMLYTATQPFIANASFILVNSTVDGIFSESRLSSYVYNSTITTIMSSYILQSKETQIDSDILTSDWTNSVVIDTETSYGTWTSTGKYFVTSSTLNIINSTVHELYTKNSTVKLYNSTIEHNGFFDDSVITFNNSIYSKFLINNYIWNSRFLFDNSSTINAYTYNFRNSDVTFQNLNINLPNLERFYFHDSNFTVRDSKISNPQTDKIEFHSSNNLNYLIMRNVTWTPINFEIYGGNVSLYNADIAQDGSASVYDAILNATNAEFRYLYFYNATATLTNTTVSSSSRIYEESSVTIENSTFYRISCFVEQTQPIIIRNSTITHTLDNGIILRSGALRINGSKLENISSPEYSTFFVYDTSTTINKEYFYLVYVYNATLEANNIEYTGTLNADSSNLKAMNSTFGVVNAFSSSIQLNDTVGLSFNAVNSSGYFNNVNINNQLNVSDCDFTIENDSHIISMNVENSELTISNHTTPINEITATNSNLTLVYTNITNLFVSQTSVNGHFVNISDVEIYDQILATKRTTEFYFVNSTFGDFEAATEKTSTIINSTIDTMVYFYKNATVINSTINTLYQFAVFNNSGTCYNDVLNGESWNVTTLINSQATVTALVGILAMNGTVNIENSSIVFLAASSNGKIIANNSSQLSFIFELDSGYIRLANTTIAHDFEAIVLYNSSKLEFNNVTINYISTSDDQDFEIYDSSNLTATDLTLNFTGTLSDVYALINFEDDSIGYFDDLYVNYTDPTRLLTLNATDNSEVFVTHSNHTSILARGQAVVKMVDSDCYGNAYLLDYSTFVFNNTEDGHEAPQIGGGFYIDSLGAYYVEGDSHATIYVYNGLAPAVSISGHSQAFIENATIFEVTLFHSAKITARNTTSIDFVILDNATNLTNGFLVAGIFNLDGSINSDNVTASSFSTPLAFDGTGTVTVDGTSVSYSGVTKIPQGTITSTNVKTTLLYSLYINGTINCTLQNFISNSTFTQILGGAMFNTTHYTGPPEIVTSTDHFDYEKDTPGVTMPSFTIYEFMADQYILYRNDTLIEQSEYSYGQVVTLDLTSLDVGIYNFTLTATDIFGYSTNATIIVEVHPPQAPIFIENPASIVYVGTDESVNLQWVCSDVMPNDYEISINESTVDSGTWDNNVPITYTFKSSLEEGTFFVNMTVSDIGGRTSTNLVTIIIDNIPPSVVATSSLWIQEIGMEPKNLTLTITDNTNGTYTVFTDGEVYLTGQYIAPQYVVTVKSDVFNTPGIHNLTLIADGGGGKISHDYTDVVVYPSENPVITGPENEYTIDVNEELILNWTAGDRFPDTYVITVNGSTVAQGFWDNTTQITYTFQEDTPGDYIVQINVYDKAGNVNTDTVTVHVSGAGALGGTLSLELLLMLIILAVAAVAVVAFVILKKKHKK